MADYFDGIHGVTAYHEPLNGLRSKEEFYKIVETGCIISDSGLSKAVRDREAAQTKGMQ